MEGKAIVYNPPGPPPANNPPVANDDSYSTPQDTTLNVPASGVLANDSDPDGDPLTALLDSNPSHGSLTLNSDGSFTYTPNAGYTGTDSFTYHANDGTDDSNIATVSIQVTPVTHFLAVYPKDWDNTGRSAGWSVVLGADSSNWSIATSGDTFGFDTDWGVCKRAIAQIDSAHYLVTYGGPGDDGWAVVLEVNPTTWDVFKPASNFEFDPNQGTRSSISKIDSTHYLVVYEGPGNDGWSVVLEVNPTTWDVSTSSDAFEFSPGGGETPVITQVETNHYLVVYKDSSFNLSSVVLEVNPTTWDVSTSSEVFVFDIGETPTVQQVDSTHYLVTYRHWNGARYDGGSKILEVDPTTWSISAAGSFFKFESRNVNFPDISQIDSTHYLVVYEGENYDGWSAVLEVDPVTWDISTSSSNFEFDPIRAEHIDCASINSFHHLVIYQRVEGSVGDPRASSVVLEIDPVTWSISTSSDDFVFDLKSNCFRGIIVIQ